MTYDKAIMTEKLKPCPFCGREATLVHPEEDGEDYVIGCYNECCGFSYERARDKNKQKVIAAWNRRISNLKYGKWILYEDEDTNAWECSVCHRVQQLMDGTPFENHWQYCPSCGTRMETETK